MQSLTIGNPAFWQGVHMEGIRITRERMSDFDSLYLRLPRAHFNFFRRDSPRPDGLHRQCGWIVLPARKRPRWITSRGMIGHKYRML